MQYTEEHYAQMYNNLPDGLKDLVLSGRLAILVSSIGARHALTAQQIADLEPAVEDVCLGLITEDELTENIKAAIGSETRVALRISADVENEIFKEHKSELQIARDQKMALDERIKKETGRFPGYVPSAKQVNQQKIPTDVSDHLTATEDRVKDWHSKGESGNVPGETSPLSVKNMSGFDWDSTLSQKQKTHTQSGSDFKSDFPEPPAPKHSIANVEEQVSKLTETINTLINSRFGQPQQNQVTPGLEDLIKRLERAEKENEENRRVIKEMKGINPVDSIFGEAEAPKGNTIPIDKERKVEIEHKDKKDAPLPTGNIQITSISKSIPIQKVGDETPINTSFSSSVSKSALDTILSDKNKSLSGDLNFETNPPAKTTLSVDELFKVPSSAPTLAPNPSTIKIEIKDATKNEEVKNLLSQDLDFINKQDEKNKVNVADEIKQNAKVDEPEKKLSEEVAPKSKEERMQNLLTKIKMMNKNVSVGGSTNIVKGTDPYRL